MKTALTIAGSDCSGGAGIQADLKTMSAIGVYGMSVITSVVAENTCGVISSFEVPDTTVVDQLNAIFSDIEVGAVKVGMLPSASKMKIVADKLGEFKQGHIVVDPVMYAKDGSELMQANDRDTFISCIVPLCSLLTPNIPEAEILTGIKITTEQDMLCAAKSICAHGAKAVLIKGGHFGGDAVDVLYDGEYQYTYTQKRINTKNTHGTGCTLSSAIASYLALGETINDAVKKAKIYITGAIENSLELGRGYGPLNHFFNVIKKV